ncbi:helix-turn-helix domain-containing protein [Haladaptatus halobius]|uniref:helix-turn-helix domain-containing protein n=1 Tax=Haladaptatus halobius TaxID=2884875 RepID=UPI001D0AA247|nr:helix-turn-helix domain-containing protein [Haladaptatus halobius]
MGKSTNRISRESIRTSQLTLKIWHPNCWTLETTAAVDAGLIAHGVYEYSDCVSALLTAYADRTEQIDNLVTEIENSEFTDVVKRINDYFSPNLRTHSAGNATEELLVEYQPQNSIHDAFVSRGFVPEEQIRMQNGYEYWTVIISESRTTIQRRLNEIRQEMNAEIAIEGMKSPSTKTPKYNSTNRLSERQREVFELAQQQGYYTWPRETSASELAEHLEISKTTMLEHLRKAEAKLLGPQR